VSADRRKGSDHQQKGSTTTADTGGGTSTASPEMDASKGELTAREGL
jgi:hypothetical protein